MLGFLEPTFFEADSRISMIRSNKHFFTGVHFVEFANMFMTCVKIPLLITDLTRKLDDVIRVNTICYLFSITQFSFEWITVQSQ
jgi:hypothetical protein